jgi:Fur family transcriptional regulator, zinc uptake regulator
MKAPAMAQHTEPPFPNPAFPGPAHNHVACLAHTLDRARTAFESQGLRLTDLRLRVFKQIAASHHAVGAYDIIERLANQGTRLAPVSVYRAIDALIEAGCVHRLESKNAFFACHANHASQRQNVVLSCSTCGVIAEVDGETVFTAIDAVATAQHFAQASRIVEITGRCAHCTQQVA